MTAADQLSLDLTQSIEIKAAIGDAYKSLVRRLTDESTTPDNRPMPMVLEQWPGGRWFRDTGVSTDGGGQGHLWGFVQVIKPPTLIEINGPMFMSYPVAGHIQFRLTPIAGGTELVLRHRALGAIEDDHRRGLVPGWDHVLRTTKQLAEQG